MSKVGPCTQNFPVKEVLNHKICWSALFNIDCCPMVVGKSKSKLYLRVFALMVMISGPGCILPVHAVEYDLSESSSRARVDSAIKPANHFESEGWSLGFETSSYISWKSHPNNDRNPYGIVLGVDKTYDFAKFDLAVSGHLYNSMNQPLLNYSHVDELSFQWRDRRGYSSLIMGRHREVWSFVDSFWHLGLWQPQFQWNYLNPEDQGLVGFFYSREPETPGAVGLNVFASPFFIPSQGPSFVMREGQFESANPWFSIPISQILIGSGYAQVKYQIHMPTAEEVILNPGFATRLYSTTSDYWWNLGGAYKPSSQLATGLRDNLRLRPVQLDIGIYPLVQYHTLGSAELGVKSGNADFSISVLAEWPDELKIREQIKNPEGVSAVQHGRTVILSPSWVYHLERGSNRRFILSYLYRDSQDIGYIGDQDVAMAAAGTDRFLFRRAISFGYDGQMYGFSPLGISLRSNYDFALKGVLLVGQLEYKLAKSVKATLGAEIIGVSEDSIPAYQNAFKQFRSNDRVFGGINYVF